MTNLTNSRTLIPRGMEKEIELHVRKVQEQMEPGEALLVASNVNVFYLTGRFFRGYIWLPAEGRPLYFVVKPQVYREEDNVVYVRKPEMMPDCLLARGYGLPARVGLEDDVLTYADVCRLRKALGTADFFNASGFLRYARMVKTPYEIGQMRIDGQRQAAVYAKIPSLYRSGMTDVTLQIAIETVLRLAGCLGYARVAGSLMEINLGSVLVGDNADTPSPYEFAMGGEGVDSSLPGGANGTEIRRGQTVMVDMNGAFNAYQTDMTRVYTLGDLPSAAYKAHDCSREILRVLEREALPGVEVCDLYFKAVEIAERAGLKEFFMGHSQQSGFIGHGVGIELNEQPPVAPRTKVALREGMTLALEPKFVLPGVGAVGVENTYVVRSGGLENITPGEESIMDFGS